MNEIYSAAHENKLLSITYKAKDGKISYRTVEPYELKDGGLYAYDISKHAIRKFLMENIISAEMGETTFSPRYPVKI